MTHTPAVDSLEQGKPKPSYAPIYAAALYPQLSELARKHGYALAVHGSLQRDFDLIAIPWVESPSDPQKFVDAITAGFAAKEVGGPPSDKPHGRRTWSLSVGFGTCAIDLSFMPALTRPPGGSERLRELAAKWRKEVGDSDVRLPAQAAVHECADELESALASPQGAEQRQEVPYPTGDVVGPCVCGSWPGGHCLRCKRIPAEPAATQGDAVSRFFTDHGMVHDRKTGKHVGKDAENLLAVLRELELDRDAWRMTAKAVDVTVLADAALSLQTAAQGDAENEARTDATYSGMGFIVDGKRIAPERVHIVISPQGAGVQAAQVPDAELAWQNIETAEVEFLNNLAEKGGLADLLPGMLRHCARLVAGRKRLLWALTEYPKRNPQQLQAAKVCAGVLKLAQPGSAAHGGEDDVREAWFMCHHPAWPDPYPAGNNTTAALATLRKYPHPDAWLLRTLVGGRVEYRGNDLALLVARDGGSDA